MIGGTLPDALPVHLGRRERQIVEVLYRLSEGAVADVRGQIPDPPTYSAVRAMLNLLVQKGVLALRRDGKRYLYRPVTSKEKVRRSALRNLVHTFFGSAPVDAMAALLDGSAGKLSADDVQRLKKLIDQAEKTQSRE